MEVRDVERVARRSEAGGLVEAGGVHAPTSGSRADEHDSSCRAVRDEHMPARIDDDGVRVAHGGLDRCIRMGRDGSVAPACCKQHGCGQRDDGEPDDLHLRSLHRSPWRRSRMGGIVTPSSRSRDIPVRRRG